MPVVLDRLNPLLERGGVLQLPECGLQADGHVRELRAHDEFRLIFTVDPARGELSRAMRNRGVEISLMKLRPCDILNLLCTMELDAPRDPFGVEVGKASSGALRSLSALPLAMMQLDASICSSTGASLSEASPEALLQWGELSLRRRRHGSSSTEALVDAAGAIYASRAPPHASTALVEAAECCAAATLWASAFPALALGGADVVSPQHTAWPSALGCDGYENDALRAAVRRQSSLLVQLTLLVIACETSSPIALPDGDSLQRMLAGAAFEFVRRASATDAILRRAVINRLSAMAGDAAHGPTLRALCSAKSLLQVVTTHPLCVGARKALRAACFSDESLWALCDASPCDLQRLNPPLFERVRRVASPTTLPARPVPELVAGSVAASTPTVCEADDTAMPASWRAYITALPRIRLLLQFEWERLLEHSALDDAARCHAPEELTLLQRSFAMHVHAVFSAKPIAEDEGHDEDNDADQRLMQTMWGHLVDALHPCLSTMLTTLLGWLQSSPRADGDEAAFLSAIKELHAARCSLWRRAEAAPASLTLTHANELQSFLVGWRVVHKRLAVFTRPPLAFSLPDALQQACDRVSRAVRFDAARFVAVLWKHGGHPAAPRSADHFEAAAALRQLAAPLHLPSDCVGARLVREQSGHPALWVAPALRHKLLLGACTIEAAGQFQSSNDAALKQPSPPYPKMTKLVDIPRAIHLHMAAQRRQRRDTADGVPQILPDTTRNSAALWPLQDARSAGIEASLLLSLASLLWRRATACEFTSPMVDGGSDARGKVQFASASVQQQTKAAAGDDDDEDDSMLCALVGERAESLVGLILNSCGRSPLDAIPAQTLAWRMQQQSRRRADVAWLAGTFSQLSATWHRHLWMGAFEFAEPASVSKPWTAAPIRGPVATLLCYEANILSAHIRRALAAPVMERGSTTALLLRIREVIHEPSAGASATAAHDWQMLLHGICYTLVGFVAEHYRPEQQRCISSGA